MKDVTKIARELSDAELEAKRRLLSQEIPAAQSMLSAIQREKRRRKRRKQGQEADDVGEH